MSSNDGCHERPAPGASWRYGRPGETCSCGRPALVAYITESWGEVPYCGK